MISRCTEMRAEHAREGEDHEEVKDDDDEVEELDGLRLAHLEMADSTTAAIALNCPPQNTSTTMLWELCSRI